MPRVESWGELQLPTPQSSDDSQLLAVAIYNRAESILSTCKVVMCTA